MPKGPIPHAPPSPGHSPVGVAASPCANCAALLYLPCPSEYRKQESRGLSGHLSLPRQLRTRGPGSDCTDKDRSRPIPPPSRRAPASNACKRPNQQPIGSLVAGWCCPCTPGYRRRHQGERPVRRNRRCLKSISQRQQQRWRQSVDSLSQGLHKVRTDWSDEMRCPQAVKSNPHRDALIPTPHSRRRALDWDWDWDLNLAGERLRLHR